MHCSECSIIWDVAERFPWEARRWDRKSFSHPAHGFEYCHPRETHNSNPRVALLCHSTAFEATLT